MAKDFIDEMCLNTQRDRAFATVRVISPTDLTPLANKEVFKNGNRKSTNEIVLKFLSSKYTISKCLTCEVIISIHTDSGVQQLDFTQFLPPFQNGQKPPNVWECKAFSYPSTRQESKQRLHVRSKCTHRQTDRQTDNLYLSMIKIQAQLLVGSCKNIIKLKLNQTSYKSIQLHNRYSSSKIRQRIKLRAD